jgi:hypothetical protein
MKLQNMTLFFALIVALCSTSVAAQRTTAPSSAVRSPEVVIKEFYKWYIHDVNGQGSNSPWKTTKGRAILKKYVTLRFIRAIDSNEKLPEDADAFDADYFLLDQDTSGYSVKSISLSKVAVKGATATAIVSFYRGDDRGVTVTLRQEGRVWKIDKVKDESGAGLVK